MKLVSATVCYNESCLIEKVIRSLVTHMDKVIILEGAWGCLIQKGYEKRSTDGTIEILEKLQKEFPDKILLSFANGYDSTEQYNNALKIAKTEEADWFLICDADEIYLKEMLKAIRSTLGRTSEDVLQYRLSSFNFLNDYFHYYEGVYTRLFKITPESFFCHEDRMRWGDKEEDRMQMPPPSYVRIFSPSMRFFHYTWNKSLKDIRRKFDFMWASCGERPDPNLAKQYSIDENGKYSIPKDLIIKSFTGRHPAIMEDLIK